MSPFSFHSLPELPLRLIYDLLSQHPGTLSCDAAALSATSPNLSAFYREIYVTRLHLGAPPPPPSTAPPPRPLRSADVFRLLSRFRRASALDLWSGLALAACGDLRAALVGCGEDGDAVARAARIEVLRLAQPMSRRDIVAVAEVCPRLERLDLFEQRALDVRAIGRLSGLRELRMVRCFACGVDFGPLAGLRVLERFVLTNTRLDRDAVVACLPGMARLRYLDVRWSGALTVLAIAVLPAGLTELKVDMRTHAFPAGSAAAGGARLTLPTLSRLTVNGSGGAGNVLYESASITKLWLVPLAPQLAFLDVWDFDFSDGSNPVAVCFGRMQKLEELRIGHVSVAVARAIATLPRLRRLAFNEATLGADVVGALGHGPARESLEHVDFRRCMYVSPAAVAGLRLSLSPSADVVCR
jgi:hypothetical protein